MATLITLCIIILSIFHLFKTSSSTIITIPLSHLKSNPNPDSFKNLAQLSASSITRAHHIKNPQITETPLTSHSYGGYSISLSFGTPIQTIPFVFDTGSSFTWFPCTHKYVCKDCPSSSESIPTFIPKASSSVRILGCLNPKCFWVHPNHTCPDCLNLKKCTEICPPYVIQYGLGMTGGVSLSETLVLNGKNTSGFVVGCSVLASHAPAGIAGFGRGELSLPSQLGVKRFSYCLLSHRFDDTLKSSILSLDVGYNSGKKTGNVSYTSLLKNPVVPGNVVFEEYYYVALRKITVGGKRVRIPYMYLSPAPESGAGGTMVDSGSTFTYVNPDIYEVLTGEFVDQMKDYKRDVEIEKVARLRPCFNISGRRSLSTVPELGFHFRGGARMLLPLENYFSIVSEEVMCLTVVSDERSRAAAGGGPAVVLGNYQMMNYYVEFDLRNERFGFRQQSCN